MNGVFVKYQGTVMRPIFSVYLHWDEETFLFVVKRKPDNTTHLCE